MSENLGRPKIADLEKLVHETADGQVEIKPNGEVVRLTEAELIEKNLRLAKEKTESLLNEARELREGLKRILAELDKLVRP
jgi:hypothetical protein